MFYRDSMRYDLTSRRVRLLRGPGIIKYLTVDGENMIYDGRIVCDDPVLKLPKNIERFKVNKNSIFIYPLRYDARIDVTYEVPEVFTMEQVQELAAKFWIKTGDKPTHLLMTVDQQRQLSLCFAPKERLSRADNPLVTQLGVAPGVMIDVLTVEPLFSGKENQIQLPKMVRITD